MKNVEFPQTKENLAFQTENNQTPASTEATPVDSTPTEPAEVTVTTPVTGETELTNRKLVYETSVTDKENALINTFSNLIENNLLTANNQQTPLIQQIQDNNYHHPNHHSTTTTTTTNGKIGDYTNQLTDEQNVILTKSAISNGNGHGLINFDNNKM